MPDAGDICLADIGGGGRRRVLVLTSVRFHRHAGRAMVAPAVSASTDGVQPPWRIEAGVDVFALDALRTIDLSRLLDTVNRADRAACDAARRALRAIT